MGETNTTNGEQVDQSPRDGSRDPMNTGALNELEKVPSRAKLNFGAGQDIVRCSCKQVIIRPDGRDVLVRQIEMYNAVSEPQ